MYYWRDKATSRLVAHEVKDGNATSVCGLVSVITKRAKRRYRATPDIPASWTLCAHCKSGQVFSTKHTGSTLQPAIRQGMAAKPSKPPRIRGEGLLFVQTDAFLDSYEWRQLRMVAIKQYGRACMCCGATPGHGLMIHVDHIKPRKYHPELALTLANLQILCEVCNHGKGNWDDTDWRQADQPDDPVAQSHMAEMRIVN